MVIWMTHLEVGGLFNESVDYWYHRFAGRAPDSRIAAARVGLWARGRYTGRYQAISILVQCWRYGTAVCHSGQSICPARRSAKVMKGFLSAPATKVIIGLLIGIGLLFLVSRFVNIAMSMRMLQQNLMTPRGIVLALLSGAFFLLAYSILGILDALFLDPVGADLT